MSLQSPFDSDFMAQMQSLQGPGAYPTRSPDDMGTREAFMRQMQSANQMQQQSFQNQMAAAQQGYGQQLGAMSHGAGLQSQAAQTQMQTAASIDQQARERHMQMMMQMQERAERLQQAMHTAGDEEQAAMAQEYAGYKQRMNDLQTKIIKAEAHSSGIAQQTTVAKQKMLQAMDDEIKAMQGLKDRANVGASEFGTTFADRLRNKIEAARNAQTGAGVTASSGLMSGYSDAHFAMRDQDIAALMAMSGDAGKAIATKAGEGQIVGAAARGLASAERGSLFGYVGEALREYGGVSGENMQDRLAGAQEQLKLSNKGDVVFRAVGEDLARGMGITDTLKAQDLRAMMMDLDTLQGIRDPQGSKQLYDEVKGRIRKRIQNLGSTVGEEGVIRYLEAAAESMGSMEVTDEKGVKTRKSRFGGVTGTGDVADMQNAIGSALHGQLSSYAKTLRTAFDSDTTIRKSDDLVNLRNAMADAMGMGGKDKPVSNMTEAALADLMKGYKGTSKDVAAQQQALAGYLKSGEVDAQQIAEIMAQQKAMALDPRNIMFQDVEGAPLRKTRTGQARGRARADFEQANPIEDFFRPRR